MKAPVSGSIDLSNQTAVVTGAGGSIGQATCEALAREGADIVAADVTEEGLSETKSIVETKGSACETVSCDVTDDDDLAHLQEVALGAFNEVEILVTAHGVVERKTLAEITREDWEIVLKINLLGTILVIQTFYDQLKNNEYGKIVCIGSISGKIGGVNAGPNYVASKGGVHAFVKWAAKDAAANRVYVNAIAPGPVESQMTEGEDYSSNIYPLERIGKPEDIAEAVVFLSSQQSHWITGTVLDVNGGLLME